ncbi:MAG: GNAT family N-acetyltransferase [Lachnospiraceae bacterium]
MPPSRITAAWKNCGQEVLALAPLSVKPRYQRQGVGTALILEGHKIAAVCPLKYKSG